MTSEAQDHERLVYIRESIARINQYTQGGQRASYTQPIVQDAVLRRLETLADATHRLSAELKARHPEIAWQQVYGFRNIAAHAYENLDLRRAWQIVERYLPLLKAVLDEELARADTP